MTWRDDKPTYKQLNLIKDLEDDYGVKFNGTPKGEASAYIDKWLKVAKKDVDRSYDWQNECRNGEESE